MCVCVCLYEFAFVYLVFDTFPLAEGHHLTWEGPLVLPDLCEAHILRKHSGVNLSSHN